MASPEELNKKLAEWAGFYCLEGLWTIRDEDVLEVRLPDFTQSLDACFKWLVPKVHTVGRGMLLELKAEPYKGYNAQVKDGKVQWAAYISERGYVSGEWSAWTGRHAESPALALCLAIEALIDDTT